MGGRDISSIGATVPLTEAKIADPADPKYIGLGPQQRGELLFRGPQVMKGYLNNAKATEETITADGWLRSGDMGYYDENGYLYVTDRLKELIKVKGYQVAPAELEALLRNHPGVLDAAVVAVSHEKYGEVPKAFVVRRTDAVSEKELQAYVEKNAAEYKRLSGGVMFLESIPKNTTGKILRRKLKEQYCSWFFYYFILVKVPYTAEMIFNLRPLISLWIHYKYYKQLMNSKVIYLINDR